MSGTLKSHVTAIGYELQARISYRSAPQAEGLTSVALRSSVLE